MPQRSCYHISGLTLLLVALLFPLYSVAGGYSARYDSAYRPLLNTTILGSLAALGFACYQGKTPCSSELNMKWDDNTFSFDSGNDITIKVRRFAIGADWGEPIYENDFLMLKGRFEVNYVYWFSTKKNPIKSSGHILGLLPVNQLVYTGWKAFQPYIEIGAGPMILNNATVEDEYKSTLFQFGDLLGIGIQKDLFEVSFRFLHYSNANIKFPNPGLDTFSFHFGYHF